MKHPTGEKLLVIATIILSVTWMKSCSRATTEVIKEGDLLFQDLNCGPLCDAIESVTEGVNGRDFSHCAVVVKFHDSLMVAEAIGDTVQLNSIENFYKRSGDSNIIVGRLKKDYQFLIPDAEAHIMKNIGEPYDEEYIMNNGKLYCSELIYEAFRDKKNQPLFPIAPMTFLNPSTGKFDTAWVDYYQKLGKAIPQGKPGINPGLISRSDKLEIIHVKLNDE